MGGLTVLRRHVAERSFCFKKVGVECLCDSHVTLLSFLSELSGGRREQPNFQNLPRAQLPHGGPWVLRASLRRDDNDPIPNVDELADLLDELQAKENDGRGVSCVRQVVLYLRRGDIGSATRGARHDHDKIRSYPEIEKLVIGNILNTAWDRKTRLSIFGDEWGRGLRS